MVRLEKGSFTYWIFPPPPFLFALFFAVCCGFGPGPAAGAGVRARVYVCVSRHVMSRV